MLEAARLLMQRPRDEGGSDRHVNKLVLPLLVLAGCGEATIDKDDDHAVDRLVLEGAEIPALLGDDRVSEAIATTEGYRRLGLLWDATEEGALEIRTSIDGIVWTEWAAPAVYSHEMIAHAGHVDAFDLAETGSVESDPLAGLYQVRVPEGKALPTFVVIEPLADIPAMPPQENVPPDPEDVVEPEVQAAVAPIKIHSRAEWGARAPVCNGGSMTPNRATIHHTVTPNSDSMTVPQRLRQIQSFHINSRGWCDIGYNFLVSRDGRVWRGRGGRTIGAHVENANTGNVGISFIGTFTSATPPKAMVCAGARLLKRLHGTYPAIALNRTDVKGHRQQGSTSCPGDELYERITSMLRQAREGCD
jgi:hypothetical protein